MCSIFGWFNCTPSPQEINTLVGKARERGRDGWGLSIDGEEFRGMGGVPVDVLQKLYLGEDVIGNFRATPTTEKETDVNILQPYRGFVHNGTIENDKDFGDYDVDSMCIPAVLGCNPKESIPIDRIQKLKGSYAIATIRQDRLFLIANYKPIYIQEMKTTGGIMFASEEYMLPGVSRPIKPYTTNAFTRAGNQVEVDIPRKHNKKVAVSLSGGLDSTTAAYMLKADGYEVIGVYFRYGCVAEDKELERVKMICEHGEFDMVVLDMPNVMSGSITEGGYHKDGRSGSKYAYDWVSARNLLMLSMLTAWSETNGVGNICFGGNLEESGSYPDNEEEFARQFNKILPYATQNGVKIELLHPLTTYMKHEIVTLGLELGVPYELTWSCYGDGDTHCASCGPCYMRAEAFRRNGEEDPVFNTEGKK